MDLYMKSDQFLKIFTKLDQYNMLLMRRPKSQLGRSSTMRGKSRQMKPTRKWQNLPARFHALQTYPKTNVKAMPRWTWKNTREFFKDYGLFFVFKNLQERLFKAETQEAYYVSALETIGPWAIFAEDLQLQVNAGLDPDTM